MFDSRYHSLDMNFSKIGRNERQFLVAKATQAFTAICNSVSHTFSVPPISQSEPIMCMVGFNSISQSK